MRNSAKSVLQEADEERKRRAENPDEKPGRVWDPTLNRGFGGYRATGLYRIVRFRPHGKTRVIKRGLTLQQAQAHCRDPKTHGAGWFDGYDEER
jgi:hypothetical protein